ncbi:MAG: hypothetical protein WBC27_12010 [Candidatus Nanopelagicales bacterium]
MTATPKNLGPAGRKLWAGITARWELDPREVALLTAACKQADDVAALEKVLKDDGLVVEGSQGQPRLNAVVTELRQSRAAVSRLLIDLRLPSEDAAPLTANQRRASKASLRRWENRG